MVYAWWGGLLPIWLTGHVRACSLDAFSAASPLRTHHQQQHDMSTHSTAHPYQKYPAYCFHASPTYDTWVKLTAADVQALEPDPNFQGSEQSMLN
jgi:hypothetical protein